MSASEALQRLQDKREQLWAAREVVGRIQIEVNRLNEEYERLRKQEFAKP